LKTQKLLVVGAIAASSLVLAACNKIAGTSGVSSQARTAQSSSSPADTNTVTYSGSGFSPNPINIKVGESVTFKNASGNVVQINSVPHPVHNLFPILNIGAINPGEGKSVTFSSAGTYKYHNHLNASQNGQIIVQ